MKHAWHDSWARSGLAIIEKYNTSFFEWWNQWSFNLPSLIVKRLQIGAVVTPQNIWYRASPGHHQISEGKEKNKEIKFCLLVGLWRPTRRRSRASSGTTRFCCRGVKSSFSPEDRASASLFPTEWLTSRSNWHLRTGNTHTHTQLWLLEGLFCFVFITCKAILLFPVLLSFLRKPRLFTSLPLGGFSSWMSGSF